MNVESKIEKEKGQAMTTTEKIREAMSDAETTIRERVATLMAKSADAIEQRLGECDFDFAAAYPYPQSTGDYRAYRQQVAQRSAASRYVKTDSSRPSYQGGRNHQYVLMRPDLDEYIVKEAEQAAESMLASYAAKLASKIADRGGDHVVERILYDGGASPWAHSKIVVYLDDGRRLVFRTRVIINVSKYGKLFNQWPTRFASCG